VSNRLDKVVVVDLEATCWRGPPPEGQEQEIIEIGVCLLDVATLERTEKESLLVRPTRSEVSAFCTELTTLTAEMLARGMSYGAACNAMMKKYQTRQRVWASWGDFDRKIFERQCAAFGTPYPFGPAHLNVKSLYALVNGLREEIGLAEAVPRMGMVMEGTHHRGVDDAWNIAGILGRLLAAARGSTVTT
jgi:inhibitor of KinA sporulation pathway (predicted exonuclease)